MRTPAFWEKKINILYGLHLQRTEIPKFLIRKNIFTSNFTFRESLWKNAEKSKNLARVDDCRFVGRGIGYAIPCCTRVCTSVACSKKWFCQWRLTFCWHRVQTLHIIGSWYFSSSVWNIVAVRMRIHALWFLDRFSKQLFDTVMALTLFVFFVDGR